MFCSPCFLPLYVAMILFLVAGCSNDSDQADGVDDESVIENTLETVISDMQGSHEARPHGVSGDAGWSSGPRVGMGNDPGNWRAMIAWGQVYEPVGKNPATNTRVQIRNIEAYYLSKADNKWHQWQALKVVEGAAYLESFADDTNQPADLRTEPDSTISVIAGDGYNFHFWTPYRTEIDPDDIKGVFTTVQARLIVDDPKQPDDRDQARFMLSVGGDYWKTMDAEWDYWTTNGDIGIGKFRFVTTDWQSFNMHTLTPAALRENPPPKV